MPYPLTTLYYAIDDWAQAPGARSNTDPTLRIQVTRFVNSDILQGQRIQVVHPQYGVLFACVVNTSGRLVADNPTEQLTTEQIEAALKKLGFNIKFKLRVALDADTRTYLQGALAAGYTHVRRADVLTTVYQPRSTAPISRFHKACIICFNEMKHPELLTQYIKPINKLDGSIMVVSPNDNPNLNFTWLSNIPMHIESVLTDNL